MIFKESTTFLMGGGLYVHILLLLQVGNRTLRILGTHQKTE